MSARTHQRRGQTMNRGRSRTRLREARRRLYDLRIGVADYTGDPVWVLAGRLRRHHPALTGHLLRYLALAALFAPYSRTAARVYETLVEVYELDFSWVVEEDTTRDAL